MCVLFVGEWERESEVMNERSKAFIVRDDFDLAECLTRVLEIKIGCWATFCAQILGATKKMGQLINLKIRISWSVQDALVRMTNMSVHKYLLGDTAGTTRTLLFTFIGALAPEKCSSVTWKKGETIKQKRDKRHCGKARDVQR